jgi:hypothetical protein
MGGETKPLAATARPRRNTAFEVIPAKADPSAADLAESSKAMFPEVQRGRSALETTAFTNRQAKQPRLCQMI